MHKFIQIITHDTPTKACLFTKDVPPSFKPSDYIDREGYPRRYVGDYEDLRRTLRDDGWDDITDRDMGWDVESLSAMLDESTVEKTIVTFREHRVVSMVEEDYNRFTIWSR